MGKFKSYTDKILWQFRHGSLEIVDLSIRNRLGERLRNLHFTSKKMY